VHFVLLFLEHKEHKVLHEDHKGVADLLHDLLGAISVARAPATFAKISLH